MFLSFIYNHQFTEKGFTAIFLTAQQDIAVDGISLKMMEEHHV
jgi:hypothetical protein